MIIDAKVQSTTKGKDGITSLTILTRDIGDNIEWVGRKVKVKMMEYELQEKPEEFP